MVHEADEPNPVVGLFMRTVRPANTWLRSIEPFQTLRTVTRESFAAGLAGDAELPAQGGHLLAVEPVDNEL